MSASVRLEAGDMFRYYSQATVNLKKHLLSQTFSIWGGEKKKRGGEKIKFLEIYHSLSESKF